MPDQETAFSRVCPSCGRRVPRNVAACRCGAALPAESVSAPVAVPVPSGGGATTIVALMVGALLLAGAGYWLFLRPAPAVTQAGAADEEEAAPEATSAADSKSAAARAWDAAASAREGAPARADDAAAATPAPVTPAAPLSAALEDMVDRVMPAIVLIETTGGRGSGFFVKHDTLITNVHVVENDSYVTLRRADGTTVNARVEKRAPAYDLAILKVATPSPSQIVLPMASTRALKPGQEIIVIGSALGTLQNSVSRGIVSGLRNSGGATLVQTDAAANPGNSGGPMLDRNGSVVGVTTFKFNDAEGLNFGVAVDHARDLLEGRLTDLGTQRGLSDIRANNNTSESDQQQQRGEEQFRTRISQLAKGAVDIDTGWKRYRDQCFKSPIPGAYDREWFAMLRGMPANASSGCPEYYAEVDRVVKEFRNIMRSALTDARRANVLPGTVRDLLRQNRLDFDWER